MDASHRDGPSFQALPLLCVAPPHLRAPFGRGARIFESPFPQGNSAPFCTISVHSKSFRIRTYKKFSCKSFRIRTYKKHRGGAVLWLIGNRTKVSPTRVSWNRFPYA